MASFDIVIDLDKISDRKSHIFRIDEVLENALNDGIKDFSEQLLEQLKLQLVLFGLGDSHLFETTNIEITNTGISISMDSDYSMFVEYGTGIIGEETPHPSPKHDWEYDIMGHGNNGWWYPTTDDDPNPYKRLGKDGVLRAWTQGMPSRPFMYQTWLWGTRSANNIINGHITRALKRLESDMK